MKIDKQKNGNIVKFYAENSGDSEYLSAIIEYTGRLNKRVSDAQYKMHEATTISADLKRELFKIKKSWVYRVLNFINLG